jgi:hypothetical protein
MTNETNDEQTSTESWESEAERFIEAAGADLGDLYAPQVRAFRHTARQLDAAGDDASAVMVAEYSRQHRWLLNKLGKGAASGGGPGDEGPDLLDMLMQNPGAVWRG